MSTGADCSPSAYEAALDALSSLISRRTRADGCNKGDGFDVMFDYLKILELDEAISELKVIHVAGTKGKGSTCTFAESILRNCGFHTGLFTSPHLIDIRERFRLDGVEISEEKFLEYFWWCWDRFKEKIDADLPMPNYFRFLALLSFKIFIAEKVDVAILEVGLGGKFDATNVVQRPIVCGISSLGYDHMEILGHTLGEIAGEKAGIFKHGVPAFTVAQPDEAMSVLKDKASQLSVPLQVSQPLDASLLHGLNLGLDGDHQYLNAGLAIELCRSWLSKAGHFEDARLELATSLPEEFAKGLTSANLQGRAQIVMDPHISLEGGNAGGLVFFLDGAHSPESMEVCAKWFSRAIKDDLLQHTCSDNHLLDNVKGKHLQLNFSDGLSSELPFGKESTQILLFNCMAVRDPLLLLPPLVDACSNDGVYFQKAVFVPNLSVFNKVGSHSLPANNPDVDLSWQRTLQRAWEKIEHKGKGERMENTATHLKVGENSIIFQSLPLALKWLRDTETKNQATRFQVLVTGSLHLVGDMLKILKK